MSEPLSGAAPASSNRPIIALVLGILGIICCGLLAPGTRKRSPFTPLSMQMMWMTMIAKTLGSTKRGHGGRPATVGA